MHLGDTTPPAPMRTVPKLLTVAVVGVALYIAFFREPSKRRRPQER